MKRDLLEWAEKASSTGWRRSRQSVVFDKPTDDDPPGGGGTGGGGTPPEPTN